MDAKPGWETGDQDVMVNSVEVKQQRGWVDKDMILSVILLHWRGDVDVQ